MNILLNILATIGISAQFLLEHIIRGKERKKNVGILIMTTTGIVLWGSFYAQHQESDELLRDLKELKSLNIDLQSQLGNRDVDIAQIRTQNDSLRHLMTEVGNRQSEFNILGKKTAEEVTRSREAIETMRNKSTARAVTSYDQPRLVELLTRAQGSIVITSVMGDQEGLQFANQLKEVFSTSGWQVNGVNQALYSGPIVGIVVRVKSQQYPKRVTNIVQAFDLLGLKVQGEFNAKLGVDDIELIIGGK